MSRIRVIEAKVKKEISNPDKKKIEPDANSEKEDAEKKQVADLLAMIPKLEKTFDVHCKIGEGTFSSVYLASMKHHAGLPDTDRKLFAIKHLVPTTHPSRVAHELRCLRDIGGRNNVIGVDLCIRHLDSVVFIMPYIPHKKFSDYIIDMGADELRRYMRALFTALKHVHTFNVIHRDVKPSNFLYDRENKRYALVDFGLAQHTLPPRNSVQPPPAHQSLKRTRMGDLLLPDPKRVALGLRRCSSTSQQPKLYPGVKLPIMSPPPAHARPQFCDRNCDCAGLGGVCVECQAWAPPRANRAGTQGFRPPEVLFKYSAQSTAVDMWAAGIVLASVLSARYPFFRATDDMTALAEITALLGTAAMHKTAKALGCRLVTSSPRHGICLRKLSNHLRNRTLAPRPPSPLCLECRMRSLSCICLDLSTPADKFVPGRTYANYPDSAFALAARLLDPDPRTRLTASEALEHPFMMTPDNIDLTKKD